jgi:hypothetical protein
MGVFSFLTCDTKKSVRIGPKAVYFLDPTEPSIKEDFYEGYGEFGGVDCYEWLSLKNFGIEDRELGISASFTTGNFYVGGGVAYFIKNEMTGMLKSHLHKIDTAKSEVLKGLDIKLLENFSDISEDVDADELKVMSIESLIKYPIKVSFNENANYFDYPGSKDCPKQGFF